MDENGAVRVAIMGASGRMGRMLVRDVEESAEAQLVAAVVRPGHDWAGKDLGEAMGGAATGVPVWDDPVEAIRGADAILDFTTPAVSIETAALAAQARAVHVIGTTGFHGDDFAKLSAAARHAVIVRAGNMSLGVNLLVEITRQVSAALGTDFDVEIVETHHNRKVDAPSGTALMLGEAAAHGRGQELDTVADRGRDGITGPRDYGKIGFHAVRGGDIVGEHDVIFAGPGERVVLRHIASDRMIFARGALRAALWGQGKPPGEYTMASVLGLR
ncbi:4-hydroxy-tetrahydrodipicolinate reductase [Rhodobacterales bacterium HKCCE3408]|nr:4-hydroxy-tetrahydrodipicolinate reductase [Rhodobacterales bacterium HKCCE3408]